MPKDRFQHKLWQLVNGPLDIIHWSKSGDSIFIDFEELPILLQEHKFCKSDRVHSFVRQLNLYGFKKIVNIGSGESRHHIKEYFNPNFKRSRKDLLVKINRRKIDDEFVDKRRRKVKDARYDDRPLQSKRKSRSTEDHEYAYSNHRKQSSRRRTRFFEEEEVEDDNDDDDDDDDFENVDEVEDHASRHFPPHVKERVRDIQEKMMKKIEEDVDHEPTLPKDKQVFIRSDSDEFAKHKGHRNDWGQSHNSGYIKYVSQDGSEIWLKKDEKYSEVHHKRH